MDIFKIQSQFSRAKVNSIFLKKIFSCEYKFTRMHFINNILGLIELFLKKLIWQKCNCIKVWNNIKKSSDDVHWDIGYTVVSKVIIEKSRGGSFYGTGIEIWAGFGPVGITEKNGPIMSNFWGQFFHVLMGKKNTM